MRPAEFRAALRDVPPSERDAWLDELLGLDGVPEDGPELARGCVPYMPCAVSTLVDLTLHARITEDDVFVDIGSGLGRAMRFVHLMTGARVIGVEIQPHLARASENVIVGDAVEIVRSLTDGTVFFLYCPFSGERLRSVLADLEAIARTHPIRICTVDLPLPPRQWLEIVHASNGLVIHRSV